MKELRFSYRMLLRFSEPVCQHRFTLRCTPLSGERQQIRGRRISVYPNEFTAEDMDAFGNRCIYGYAEGAHDHFSFSVSGTAYTGLQPYENAPSEVGAGTFKYQTAITQPGEALRSFSAQQKRLPDEGGLAFAVRQRLRRHPEYLRGTVDIYPAMNPLGIDSVTRGIICGRKYYGHISRIVKSEDFLSLRAERAGFFQPFVRPGEQVVEGQRLAVISDPLLGEPLSTITAPADGVAAFVQDEPMCYQHTAVIKLIGEEQP